MQNFETHLLHDPTYVTLERKKMRIRSPIPRTLLGIVVIGFFLMTSHILLNLGSTYVQSLKSFSGVNERNVNDVIQKSDAVSLHRETNNVINAVSDENVESERKDCRNESQGPVEGLPTIYMITPTYRRAEQIPELTRTGQTLLHVKNLVWIVVEDASKPSSVVIQYLAGSGVRYVYMTAQMPAKFKTSKNKPRGVANRNAGLEWVKKNATEGVVYFGDDDNTYDLRVFEEMRWTKKVSMFPVGLVTKLGVSTPIVRKGKVIGFYDGWIANRKFPVDMAGFAVSVDLIKKNPNCSMPFVVGYEEDGFLKSLHVKPTDIEPKASNCTKIFVWHTQTTKNGPAVDAKNVKIPLENTNLIELRKQLWRGA